MRAGVQRVVGTAGPRCARTRARLLAGALAGALAALLLTACASGGGAAGRASAGATGASAAGHSDAGTDCRARWNDLQQTLAGRDASDAPSDLAARWMPVIATAAHYATTATAADCTPGAGALDRERASIAQLERFSARLRVFDVPHRMSVLAPAATDYLLGAPPSPSGSGAHRPTVPSRAAVQRALTVLQTQGPAAVRDMADGWAEATTVDLDDEAAVRRTLADLRFLAGDSTPFQACLPALAVLEDAAAARG